MKEILCFLLDGYADWESGYVCAKLNKPELCYIIHTISIDKKKILSQGNLSTNINYTLDTYHNFSDLACFILIGGTGWRDQHLIRGYHLEEYDKINSRKITALIDLCLSSGILVAAICDGATFMADNGYLNNIPHTGNSLSYLKEKAPFYMGEQYFQEQQAVSSKYIITANGTAPLEFVRDILIALNILGGEQKARKWFQLFKNGYYHQ